MAWRSLLETSRVATNSKALSWRVPGVPLGSKAFHFVFEWYLQSCRLHEGPLCWNWDPATRPCTVQPQAHQWQCKTPDAPDSASAAPATKSAHLDSHSAAPATKSAQRDSICASSFTKCCACHEICTSRFTQCCACHEICASRFTKCCACHAICTSRFTKCCACHEISTSRFTKCCACHAICTSRFTKCCACYEICTSRFTKCCACHELCTSEIQNETIARGFRKFWNAFQKCCACHEIMPAGHTKCCTGHAKSSSSSNSKNATPLTNSAVSPQNIASMVRIPCACHVKCSPANDTRLPTFLQRPQNIAPATKFAKSPIPCTCHVKWPFRGSNVSNSLRLPRKMHFMSENEHGACARALSRKRKNRDTHLCEPAQSKWTWGIQKVTFARAGPRKMPQPHARTLI